MRRPTRSRNRTRPTRVGFPWYDVGTATPGWDALWDSLRPILEELGFGPLDHHLDRRAARSQWADPALLLSQCCGLDVVCRASGLQPIAAPLFRDLDCEPGDYYSLVIARDEPPNHLVVAVNDPHSRSGHTSLIHWLAETHRRATRMIFTGSHAQSIEMVRTGRADIAAIDAISWRALGTPEVEIIGRTQPGPAPPFITQKDVPTEPLRHALGAAIDALGAHCPLGLSGIVPVDGARYEVLRDDVAFIEGGDEWSS